MKQHTITTLASYFHRLEKNVFFFKFRISKVYPFEQCNLIPELLVYRRNTVRNLRCLIAIHVNLKALKYLEN